MDQKAVSDKLQRIANRLVSGSETKIVGPDVRITLKDSTRQGFLRLQELPRKPLKRQLQRATYSDHFKSSWIPEWRTKEGQYVQITSFGWMFGVENIANMAKLSSTTTFDKGLAAVRKAIEKAAKEMEKEYKRLFKEEVFYYERRELVPVTQQVLTKTLKWLDNVAKSALEIDEVFYLNVEPHDYDPIHINGTGIRGTFEWTKFKFYPTEDPSANPGEGMSSFYDEKSAGGARKLFKLMKGDPALFEKMPEKQFLAVLAKSKIGYSYNPTVWR